MTQPPVYLTGSRIALLQEEDQDPYAEYECTACGGVLRGQREIVAVPRHGIHAPGMVTYSLVHNREECVRVVT